MSQFIEMFKDKGYPLEMIKSFADVSTGGTPSKAHPEYWNGDKPWVSAEDMKSKYVYDTCEKVTNAGYATCKIIPVDTLMYVCRGSIGVMAINKIECATNQSICRATCHDNVCNVEFLYHALMYQRDNIKKMGTGTSFKSLNQTTFSELEIELPPYEEQMKFVAIAEQADKSGFDGFKSQFIEMFKGDFPKLSWEECLTIINGKKYDDDYQESGTYPICGSGGIMGYGERMLCPKDTVILGRKGNINSPIYMETDYWIVDTAFCLDVDRTKLHPKYFYFWCKLFDFTRYNKQGVLPSLTKNDLLKIEMPIPPMELQTKFVDILELSDKSGSVGLKSGLNFAKLLIHR